MTKFKYKPLKGRVVVKPFKAEDKTASGIFIPDSAKKQPQKGTIWAMGDDKTSKESLLREGDVIIYREHAGVPIEVDDEDYLILEDKDILLVE